MTCTMITLQIFLILALVFCAFMVYRNSYVYGIRSDILERSRWNATKLRHIEAHRLPSYDVMMFQLWKWDYSEVLNDDLYDDIEPKDELYHVHRGEFKLIEAENPKK